MADWQVGDLALCVKMPPTPEANPTRPGQCYTVERVWMHPNDILALDFVGIFNGAPHGFGFWGHMPSRFVKVTPPEADEFDREVIALLTGKPEQVTG